MNDWIDIYLQYTSQTESPKDFHYWVAISILATVTNRNLYIDRGFYKLYPNLYILLMAQSALCRKSTAINMGLNLINKLESPIMYFADSCTAPSLLKYMSEESGKCFICASEMSTFITDVYKTGLTPIITRIYDSPDIYKTATIKRGVEILYNVFINILGGTTPSDIKDLCAYNKAGAGLPSRFIFIYKDYQEKIIPHPIKTERTIKLEQILIDRLNQIRKLEGAMVLSSDADKYYVDWYINHCNNYTKNALSAYQGYIGRKHDILLKLAMIFSLARNTEMTILKEDIQKANDSLTQIEEFQYEVLRMISSTSVGVDITELENYIKSNKSISYSDIIKTFSFKWSIKELNPLLDSLYQSGLVEISFTEGKYHRQKKIYTWKGGII